MLIHGKRSPRTLFLQRLLTYLSSLTFFADEIAAFRRTWAIGVGGFDRDACESHMGLSGSVDDLWRALAHAYHGYASERDSERDAALVGLTDWKPWRCLEHPELRGEFRAARWDYGVLEVMNWTDESRHDQTMEYVAAISDLVHRWRAHVPALGKLGLQESEELVLDVAYHPALLRERLELEYRTLDFLENPNGRFARLTDTFTSLYPDIEVERDEQARPTQFSLIFQRGISKREMIRFAEEAYRIVNLTTIATEGAERVYKSLKQNRQSALLEHTAMLALKHSGLSARDALEGVYASRLEKGILLGEQAIRMRFKELERDGFRYIEAEP